jgi:hypothetical protein
LVTSWEDRVIPARGPGCDEPAGVGRAQKITRAVITGTALVLKNDFIIYLFIKIKSRLRKIYVSTDDSALHFRPQFG